MFSISEECFWTLKDQRGLLFESESLEQSYLRKTAEKGKTEGERERVCLSL